MKLNLDVSERLSQPTANHIPDFLAGASAHMIYEIVGKELAEAVSRSACERYERIRYRIDLH